MSRINLIKMKKELIQEALFFIYVSERNLRRVAPLDLQGAERKPFFPEMLNDGGQTFNRFFVSYAVMHK